MKKELGATIILVILVGCAWINICCAKKLCENMTKLTEESAALAYDENWDEAEQKAELALNYWNNMSSYTHIFLRHSEVDSTTEAIYHYLAALYQQEPGNIKAAAMEACAHYSSLLNMEKIRLGSIL